MLISLACLSHQIDEDSPAVLISSPNPYGIIPPQSTVHIPLILETQVTGEHRTTIYISVFGSQDHPVVRDSLQIAVTLLYFLPNRTPPLLRHKPYLHVLPLFVILEFYTFTPW